MPAPVSVLKNDYLRNRKSSSVYTPRKVSKQLSELALEAITPAKVLDAGCGKGRLSLPYYQSGSEVLGIDLVKKGPSFGSYLQGDLLSCQLKPVDLVVCNPPFNNEGPGRKLLPEVWLKHIFEQLGYSQAVMMIAPMGFRLNQRRSSARYRWILESKAEITGLVSLPIDAFQGVLFHAEVLFFNIPGIKPHSFLKL